MARSRTAAKLHLLTVREVQTAPDGDHTDGGGLLLRVRGASCSWVFRYTAPGGRRREMGLGVVRRGSAAQVGDSLSGARDLAHEARAVLLRGLDPIDDRAKAKAAAQEADKQARAAKRREHMTLARAARDYHGRVIELSRTAKHAAQWINSLENHVPAEVWRAPIAEIDAPQLLAALTKIRALDDKSKHVPETLQRIRQRLDAVFEDAIFHKRCASNPAAAIRRKLGEAQTKRVRGEFAALPYREAPAFMAALRSELGTAARGLEFAVLTASRTGEVLQAAWAQFDLEAGLWVIPADLMKGGEEHTVYLSARALEIVRGQLGQDRRLVFPSPLSVGKPRAPGKPLSNMAMLTLLGRMQMRERTTVHGLCRATFSTWANETAAARPEVVEACLAHREADKVKAAYNRAQFIGERRALMDSWCAYLATPAASVVPIRAA